MKEDIIRMAREAGIKNDCDGVWCTADQLERFASLVAAAEREACAKVCEQWEWANNAAAAIRATVAFLIRKNRNEV
jgi:hypothetical protein